MGAVLDFSERAWAGELGDWNIHVGRALVDFEVLRDDLAFLCGVANSAVFATGEGLFFFDASGPFHVQQLYDQVRAWTDERAHTVVYSHGHVDHVFGLYHFVKENKTRKLPPIEVIAHENGPPRFDRYTLTHGYNAIINQRQFSLDEPVFPDWWPYPTRTFRDRLDLEIGRLRVELYHDRSETDDAVWAWMPEKRILCTGDLFLWVSPNAGNPQKVQRYPREWAMGLRKMEALDAEMLLPGHGPPIIGADRVKRALSETASLLETLVEQSLALLNRGATLNEILHTVKMPRELLERPYLRPIYDDPSFILQNVWRLYGGWYDGNPSHLKPARDGELGACIAEVAGGVAALAGRARALAAEGRLDVACHLAEFAWQADPKNEEARAARADIYRLRAESETGLMAQGIYRHASRTS